MKAHAHHSYIFTPATVKPPHGSFLKRVIRFFTPIGYCPHHPQRCNNGVGIYPMFTCDVTGYHAPCYPPNMKSIQSAPVHRGHITWNYDLNIRTVVQQRMDSF